MGPVKSVDVGLSHCIALSECSSKIFTWGKGTDGQLGVGPMKSSSYPMAIKSLKGSFVQISAGFYHSAAVSSAGFLYVWGKGMASVLRRGSQTGQACINLKKIGETATLLVEYVSLKTSNDLTFEETFHEQF